MLSLSLCNAMGCSPPGSSVDYMGFSRQEDWSGLPFPLPGNLPTQGLNPHLLHCRQILYHRATGGTQLLLGYFETRRNLIYLLSLLLSISKLCGFRQIIKSVWMFILLSLIVVRAHISTAPVMCLFVLCITPSEIGTVTNFISCEWETATEKSSQATGLVSDWTRVWTPRRLAPGYMYS